MKEVNRLRAKIATFFLAIFFLTSIAIAVKSSLQKQKMTSKNQIEQIQTNQVNNYAGLLIVENREKIVIQLGGQKLEVEVVNSAASITQGLSSREEIGSDGMLFVFEKKLTPSFWMKEMKFDLDMIWLLAQKDDQTGQEIIKIVDIIKNVPAPDPGTSLKDLPRYSPNQPANMILEVESEKVAEWGLVIGDQLIVLN